MNHVYTNLLTIGIEISVKITLFSVNVGRELAVKIVDINHIDHAAPSTDSLNMQKVCTCIFYMHMQRHTFGFFFTNASGHV